MKMIHQEIIHMCEKCFTINFFYHSLIILKIFVFSKLTTIAEIESPTPNPQSIELPDNFLFG